MCIRDRSCLMVPPTRSAPGGRKIKDDMFARFQQLIQVPGVAIQILQLEIRGERSVFQLSDCPVGHREEEGLEQEWTHRVMVLETLITYTRNWWQWLGGTWRKLGMWMFTLKETWFLLRYIASKVYGCLVSAKHLCCISIHYIQSPAVAQQLWSWGNWNNILAVSYTHLDVYKRQEYRWSACL